MAYKQTPGRGNSEKTGNGLPSTLRQDGEDDKMNKKTSEQIGYTPKTSALPNTESKGGYEKTLDKVGNMMILRGGDKKEISRAQIGTKQAESMKKTHEAKKGDTEARRMDNLNFLKSRELTGKIAK
jgi:hypothetical protein